MCIRDRNSASATQNSWIKQGGTWYWLTDSGAMATGWAKAADGKWYYFEGSGAMQSSRWLKQGTAWYYLSGSGAMQTGWLLTGGAWYWMDPESGMMACLLYTSMHHSFVGPSWYSAA